MTSGMAMADYLRQANDGTVIFGMIETRTAIANIDAILAVSGIDGVFVGPSDLSIALSNGASLDPNGKAVDEACEKIVAAARKAGKVAGAYTGSAARANEQAARGFRFIAVSSDGGMLNAGAAAALKELKK
jgi:4-hydroxy-2-oxoheptanedioate aldolase